MSTAIAVDANPSVAENTGWSRASLAGVFVVVGLVLLYAASRIVRRHHPHRRLRY